MLICGIDEAGRGPVAGPLVVAGCILHEPISGVNDSKKLTSKKRQNLYLQITHSSTYKIVTISNDLIDRDGLSQSIQSALVTIKQNITATRYIFDGNSRFGVDGIETLIKGDQLDQNIAAASILAKVTRDRYMDEVAKDYPQFSFAKHKGYITKTHIKELQEYGYTKIHRKSVKIKALEPTLF